MSSRYYNAPINNQGSLHRLENERDACGVGCVTHIRGQRSYRILRTAVDSVCHMTHRGAIDADQKTGDGAGILTQIPHAILIPAAEEMGARINDANDLGVGVMFLPTEGAEQIKAKILCEGILRNRGCTVHGWREVPVNPRQLGEKARETMPAIYHLLVGRPESQYPDTFERTLFLARREIEIKARLTTRSPRGTVFTAPFPTKRYWSRQHSKSSTSIFKTTPTRQQSLSTTSDSAQTHSRPGRWASRSACLRTTAKSTLCEETGTGCPRASATSRTKSGATTSAC